MQCQVFDQSLSESILVVFSFSAKKGKKKVYQPMKPISDIAILRENWALWGSEGIPGWIWENREN